MSHVEPQSGAHLAPEAIREKGKQRAGASGPTAENIVTYDEEEKNRVFKRIESTMDNFRVGNSSSFQATSNVIDELDKWSGVSDRERERALKSYLSEINANPSVEIEECISPEITQPTRSTIPSEGTSKRPRQEVEDLLEKMSRGEPDDDDDDERRLVKRRAREEEMPWFNQSGSTSRRSSCVETCKTIKQFSEDLSGVKSLLRIAYNLPEGIPSTQWDRIIRGESVDLNQLLSSMHYIQLDEERKGRLGNAEVVFAVAESKRQIKTGGEWSAAFRRLIKGITFLFPHRRDELYEYADYVEGLFAAKQTNAHSKVILFDQAVRNRVGGGQNLLLTDYPKFQNLTEAILHADGVEYGGYGSSKGKSTKGGGSSSKSSGGKKDTCKRFNSQNGCKFTEEECYYKHICQGCGKGGHGKANCPSESQ